ncbi:MAG: heme exporter protein CcmD [Rhodoferax sp.]|nr:heme exporter protein CcmD [Betaproteobacteria bacterium]NCN96343.1 heme exporter protein CcmD [Rhodoferax sp.]OIP13141.1 MAG: heme exporter protein CcmD [Comamonadaceae bacterium CG2_30_57_122]PIZ22145.1 MAG: heme exporter protein CcmD [Comamonadaceae bacterium CG_4_10_14_0_8_um_filter_57_29]PJC22270.1 MAG: heme exporter protein CcmD [Comamonadaceae bacterium CG_4_9_14_0_8_um_filter_57_21]
MQWNSVAEFLDMGGYAFYVWGSFGITALVVVYEIWEVRARRREVLRNLLAETSSTTD